MPKLRQWDVVEFHTSVVVFRFAGIFCFLDYLSTKMFFVQAALAFDLVGSCCVRVSVLVCCVCVFF